MIYYKTNISSSYYFIRLIGGSYSEVLYYKGKEIRYFTLAPEPEVVGEKTKHLDEEKPKGPRNPISWT